MSKQPAALTDATRQPVATPAPDHARVRVMCSEEVFGTAQEVWIKHQSVVYRLQHTKSGKLILIK